MLMGIVMTGAGVRLTGSGLGCPDWPKCGGGVAPPLQTHALIEFGNRVLSGLVGITAAAAGVLAFRRRPYRRDLAAIGLLLPLGVVGQAVLGGYTVKHHLAPGFVMGHYILSMLLLTAAVTLLWRSRTSRAAARGRRTGSRSGRCAPSSRWARPPCSWARRRRHRAPTRAARGPATSSTASTGAARTR
jgi:cytochrome c oxidase assembly protein subunit 15